MILDVAAAVGIRHHALELVEELARVLAEDVHQHVQPTPVRHADDGLDDAVRAEPLQRLVQHGDEALAAFEAEPLGARITGVQVVLEPLGGGETIEHRTLGVRRELRRGMNRLQPLPHPKLLGGIRDVHVFDAERAAVGLLQRRHDVAQGRLPTLEELRGTGAEDRVEVRFGEVVVGEVQLGRRLALPHAERVQRRPQVAPATIGDDEFEHANLLALVLGSDLGGNAFRLCPQAVAT